MDAKSGLEAAEAAVRAIRGTLPEAEQPVFDDELAIRLGLVTEAAGATAVADQIETETNPIDLKEAITEQLDTAFMGYQITAGLLNKDRRKSDKVTLATAEAVGTEFIAWFTEEKIEQARGLMEADPELRFTLVATPNVKATANDLLKVAKIFGNGQPHETYFWSDILARYSAEQLSGTSPDNGNSIQFSLIPNKFDPRLYGTVPAQRAALAKLQTEMPDLRVPSFLEDMTYWQTLRSQGDDLAHGAVFDRTYIRHFDLPEQRVDGDDYVLISYVDGSGEPDVGGSYVRAGDGGRALVG